jgi:hypothetical protein
MERFTFAGNSRRAMPTRACLCRSRQHPPRPRIRLGPFQILAFARFFPSALFSPSEGWRVGCCCERGERGSSPHSHFHFLGGRFVFGANGLVEMSGVAAARKERSHFVSSTPKESRVEAAIACRPRPTPWRPKVEGTSPARLAIHLWFDDLDDELQVTGLDPLLFLVLQLSWYTVRAQILLFMARCNALDAKEIA